MKPNTQFEKNEIPKPAIQIMDCSNNEKLVIKKVDGGLLLFVLDSSDEVNGILALRLKKPFAKNFAKLADAVLPLNDFIVEKIEVRGGE